jgi:hypothetical protein
MVMTLLTKAAIEKIDDLKYVEVNVPEWGGKVRIKTISASQRDKFEEHVLKSGNNAADNIRARLAVMCIVDEHNKNIFTESDIKMLGNKSAAALDRIFSEAQKLNFMSDKDIEDLAKN